VIESVAKTSTEPSRLAIRMDSVQWKDGSAAVKIYLTAWIYPTTVASGQDLQYGPQQSQVATWNGEGAYPDPNSRVVKPFPGGDSKSSSDAVPNTTAAVTMRRRVPMKNVMSGRRCGDCLHSFRHQAGQVDHLRFCRGRVAGVKIEFRPLSATRRNTS
jgi:hypothetical protein